MMIRNFSIFLFLSLSKPIFSYHPELSRTRVEKILEKTANASEITLLITTVNSYYYCSTKQYAIKQWTQSKWGTKAASSNNQSKALINFMNAICTADSYMMGSVYQALQINGPLDTTSLEALQEEYQQKFAIAWMNDALYAATYFTIKYMQWISYDRARMQFMIDALQSVQSNYSPYSTMKRTLMCAYRTLSWPALYSATIQSFDWSANDLFNSTIQQGISMWTYDSTFCDSLSV